MQLGKEMAFTDPNQFPEELAPIQDTIHGALYDEKGLAYLVFLRSRPSAYITNPRAMAQSVDGRIFRLREVKIKGVLMFRRFCVTLQSIDGTAFSFSPADAKDFFVDSIARLFAFVTIQTTAMPQLQDFMPDDYWRPLNDKCAKESTSHFETGRGG